MKREISLRLSISRQNSPITRKYYLTCLLFFREWDRFAKAEYERLAMEEENGEDSEMMDAMEGWDSDQDGEQREGGPSKEGEAKEKKKEDNAGKLNAA
jgi:hypothetical protein